MAAARVKLDVRVTLMECTGLRKAETGLLAGKNDPFVKVSLLINDKKEGTRISPVINNAGRDARWNPPHGWNAAIETLQRTDPSDRVELLFDVFDKNTMTEDVRIGVVKVDLATLSPGRARTQFELEHESKSAGKVDAIIELNVPVYAPGCAPGDAEAAAAKAAEAAAIAAAAAKAEAELAAAEERAAAAEASAKAARDAAAQAAAEAAAQAEAETAAQAEAEAAAQAEAEAAAQAEAEAAAQAAAAAKAAAKSRAQAEAAAKAETEAAAKAEAEAKIAAKMAANAAATAQGGDSTAFSVGASVRVKPSVSSPKYGWGSVSAGDVGTVKSVESDSRMRVDFPGKNSNWLADPSQMEEAAAAFSVGASVRVKPSVSSPKYGWGSVSAGDVGTVKSVESDSRMRVDFPGKNSNWLADPSEMEEAASSS